MDFAVRDRGTLRLALTHAFDEGLLSGKSVLEVCAPYLFALATMIRKVVVGERKKFEGMVRELSCTSDLMC